MSSPRLFIAMIFLTLMSSGVFADTITVCESGCDHDTIQAAMDAAAEQGDVIEIGAGVWMENLYSNKQMILRGAGPDLTIIDGSDSQFDSESCLTVSEDFDGWETQERFRVESLTLRGGSGSEIFGLVRGGGAYIEFVPVTFSNVVIEDCSIESLGEFTIEGIGGAICNYYGDVTVESSVLRNNSAFTLGGAIFSTYGSLRVFDTVIEGNNGEIEGGAIFINEGLASIEQSTICNNSPVQIYGTWTDNGGNTIEDECPLCPGDATGDGYVDVNDVLYVIANWDTADPNADFDEDGLVDADDVLILLSNFGEACP